jgi:hypothetical protein
MPTVPEAVTDPLFFRSTINESGFGSATGIFRWAAKPYCPTISLKIVQWWPKIAALFATDHFSMQDRVHAQQCLA